MNRARRWGRAGAALALGLAGCSSSGGGGGGPPDGGGGASGKCSGAMVETKAIRYAATDEKNTFNLYRPEHGDACPVVAWVHGGAWEGDPMLSQNPDGPVLALVGRGYAVAALRFRLSSDAPWPAEIHDVKAAVRYLRAHAAELGVDPDRMAAWGVSSGGHLAALLAVSSEVPALEDPSQGSPGVSTRIAALVDCYGPTALPDMDAEILANKCNPAAAYHDEPSSPESRFLGCAKGLHTDCPQAHDADPATYVDASDPPAHLAHGLADCTVPWEQSQHLEDALEHAGVTSSFTKVPGTGHELASCGDLADVYDFFDAQLGAPGN